MQSKSKYTQHALGQRKCFEQSNAFRAIHLQPSCKNSVEPVRSDKPWNNLKPCLIWIRISECAALIMRLSQTDQGKA